MDWANFVIWLNWKPEAFATLVAGVAAVIGAVVIGLRQSAIQRRQTDIQARQAEILASQTDAQHDANRIALFERRMEVYRKLIELAGWAQNADSADPNDTGRVSAFTQIINEARILFPADTEVAVKLKEAQGKISATMVAATKMRAESRNRTSEENVHAAIAHDMESFLSLYDAIDQVREGMAKAMTIKGPTT